MRRQLQQSYTFTPGASGVGKISFDDYQFIDKKRILGITNTTRNIVIYNPQGTALGGTVGTGVNGNILTLTFDTTTHAVTDDLLIAYENGDSKVASLASALAVVSYVNITTAGAGYTSIPTVAFVGNTSTVVPTAVAIMSSNDGTGSVIGIRITNPGVSTVAPTSATLTGGGAPTILATLATPISGNFVRQYIDGEAIATIQIYGSWAGTVIYESSVDGFNFQSFNAVNVTSGAISTSTPANTLIQSEISGFKYIQARLNVAASGNAIVNIRLSSSTGLVGFDTPLPSGSNTLGTVNTTALPNQTAGVGLSLQAYQVIDIPSSAITITTNSATITQGNAQSAQFNIQVTAVSGTTPTLDVSIEESDDSGTSWYPVFQLQRITAVGSYRTPVMRLSGNRIRYVQTVGGTTPSFTRAINRNNMMLDANNIKVFVDRTINPNTLNSTSPAYFVGGSDTLALYVNLGTATTAPVIQLEGSEDNLNFYSIAGTALTTTANITVYQSTPNALVKFVRARVSTAGSAAVLGYIEIKALGR